MTDYIVILSVGPVQTMIDAARKSRDLWSGSCLLSEIAKACALSLYRQKAELIFPAVDKNNAQHLKPNSNFSVGNKIQVKISAANQDNIREVVKQAKEACYVRFAEIAEEVKKDITPQALRLDIWQRQVNDYIEVQAAWAKIDEENDAAYMQAVELATKVLQARKVTRDFSQTVKHPDEIALMIPKSSLDGARETVLSEHNITQLQLGLSKSEQLDCIGVVKRLGLKQQAEQFTPVTRVAVQAWIESIQKNDISNQQLNQINACYEILVKCGLATNVKGNGGIYNALPYDGQLLYCSRLEAELRENKEEIDKINVLTDFKRIIEPLWRSHGQPCSYMVLLHADGDRMGELLSKAQNSVDHKKITMALSQFAGGVTGMMRKYQGHCIYAGGDDVLGLVPLYRAYDCAKALSESFVQCLAPVAKALQGEEGNNPTLSVGLAIAHYMTPFGIVRELAKKAEKQAKGDHIEDIRRRRNALGMSLDMGSGSPISLRLGWNETDAHTQFNQWITLYDKKSLPSRIAYDTQAIDLRTQRISTVPETQKGIQLAEFCHMLNKARLTSGEYVPDCVQHKLKERAEQVGLKALSDELIIARWLAAKIQQDLDN